MKDEDKNLETLIAKIDEYIKTYRAICVKYHKSWGLIRDESSANKNITLNVYADLIRHIDRQMEPTGETNDFIDSRNAVLAKKKNKCPVCNGSGSLIDNSSN